MNEEIKVCLRVILRTLIFILKTVRFNCPRIDCKEAEKHSFNIQVALRMMENDE